MSADLTIAQIERIRDGYSATGFFNDDAAYALIQHALAEPARLASAHTEGVRDAIERCAAEAWRYAGFYPPHSDGRNTFAMLADCFDRWSGALSPPPEPTGGTAEPSAPVAPEDFEKPSPGASVAEIEAAGYRNTIMAQAARIIALEAENARLRRELEPLAREAERYDPPEGDGTENLSEAWDSRFTIGHLRRARALLQGGPDAG